MDLMHEAYAVGIPYSQSEDIVRKDGEAALRSAIEERKRLQLRPGPAAEPWPHEVTPPLQVFPRVEE